jgi:hypothetical protein
LCKQCGGSRSKARGKRSELVATKRGSAVELESLKAGAFRTGAEMGEQGLLLGTRQLSVQVARDRALRVTTGEVVSRLLMPHQQEAHAYVDAA